MPNEGIIQDPQFKAALLAHEQQERLNTGQVAAALVVALMPAGVILDRYVYPDVQSRFLALRLICSGLALGLLWLFRTPFGQRYYRYLGLPIPWLPAAFMAWMIYEKEGSDSPYYAGLTLVMLAVSVVVHWRVWESVLAIAGIMAMYGAACWAQEGAIRNPGIFINNVYFIAVTGVIVAVGNLFYNRLHFREFALRFELDRNRQQLEENNRKLLEIDQIKSRFFANISHELRTPLTLLIAPLENLIARFSSSFDESTRQTLHTMHSNGMRLLKLINDLLDLVRLESGVMHVKREAVKIDEFLRGLASAARQVADDKRLTLATSVAPEIGTVLVDRDKLEKIILNLQFNALKFTPAGGRVDVGAERQDQELVISVKDTGMGISEQNLPSVFSRFWQADDSSRRKYQGMGIGLALVKELTEVQNGKVSVESEEGKGTTFSVRLPFLAPDPNSQPQPAKETEVSVSTPVAAGSTVSNQDWLSNLYRRAEMFPAMTAVRDAIKPVETARASHLPKVLIADDEPDMLRFLKSQLEDHFQVLEAVDGQQAIEKASQFLPDIILLDMMMPEKDGIQACKELRERMPTASIPVILITARADEETKMAALSAGASDFLPKPFSTAELHVRVKNLVESYAYQRKLSKQNQLLENTIEQLKETESQLVQTEKLASLGRLSAGIIHEINNPLNYATTGLFTLRKKAQWLTAEQRPDYEEVLRDVEEGIHRVKTIVSDLRAFAHRENEHCSDLEAADAVTVALRFLSREWRDKVRIEQNLPPGLTFYANRNRLIQVLINLLQNSLDAIEEKTFSNEQPTIWITGEQNNGHNTLRIRDNGTGIAPEHLDKIFDPFFTTKDVGKGMGLGLSICYRIVQEYDGHISVSSEPGKFCEFAVNFPVKTHCEAA